jgi:hypothetical protein
MLHEYHVHIAFGIIYVTAVGPGTYYPQIRGHDCTYTYIETLQHVATMKGLSSGTTDTFHEHGQQNTCPDVNVGLKGSVLYVTWQLSARFWWNSLTPPSDSSVYQGRSVIILLRWQAKLCKFCKWRNMPYTNFRGSLIWKINISKQRCTEEWHIWLKPNSCTFNVELFGIWGN